MEENRLDWTFAMRKTEMGLKNKLTLIILIEKVAESWQVT